MPFSHQPPSKKARITAIIIVSGALVAAIATYYFRGFNEIVLSDLPEGADEFLIMDYYGCGSLDHESYPIEDGKVTMEWSYAIKTSTIQYCIVADGQQLVGATYRFGPRTRHSLRVP